MIHQVVGRIRDYWDNTTVSFYAHDIGTPKLYVQWVHRAVAEWVRALDTLTIV